jgi:hypothetical protein
MNFHFLLVWLCQRTIRTKTQTHQKKKKKIPKERKKRNALTPFHRHNYQTRQVQKLEHFQKRVLQSEGFYRKTLTKKKRSFEAKTCKEESWFSRDSRASQMFKSLSISSSSSSSGSLSSYSCSGPLLGVVGVALWMQLLIFNRSSVALASTNPIPPSSISVSFCVSACV